jgi:hypothetical protein
MIVIMFLLHNYLTPFIDYKHYHPYGDVSISIEIVIIYVEIDVIVISK